MTRAAVRPSLTITWSSVAWPTALSFLGAWLLFLSAGIRPIIGDSDSYRDLATALLGGQPFNDQFHGYAAQLLFAPAVLLDRMTPLSIEQAALIEASAVMALAAWFVLPWFVSSITGRPVQLIDRVVTTAVLWAFWGAYASFVLTDFPALLLFLAAVTVAWRKGGIWPVMLAGVAIGLAYNLRPAYVLAMVGLVILVAAQRRHAPALLLGIALALAPQSIVNLKTGASAIPVPAEAGAVGSAILAAGLSYQRTASSLDPAWPSVGITSCDPDGARLAGGAASLTMTGYAGILASDPVASAGLLTRRVVNGLWLDQRGPVVEQVTGTSPLGVASILLVVLFVGLAWSGVGRVALLLVALACVPAIVAVVEPRHFIPLAVVSAAMLVPAVRWLRGTTNKTRTVTAVTALVLVLGSFGIARATTGHDVPGAWFEGGWVAPVAAC